MPFKELNKKRTHGHTRFILSLICTCCFVFSCDNKEEFEVRELTGYVDPYIGADRTSNNAVGPQMPWGSVQPQPDTDRGNFAGYLKDEPILGFSQTRLTGGGGAPPYGNFLISPQLGLEVDAQSHGSPKSGEKPGYRPTRGPKGHPPPGPYPHTPGI
mgnify:CR=1 FL=1